VADGCKAGKHAVQKESEPGAFPMAGRADPIHAVVPIARTKKRKTMSAGGRAFVDRPDAMLEQRAVFARQVWHAVGFVLIIGQERRRQERYSFIENLVIAGGTNVLS